MTLCSSRHPDLPPPSSPRSAVPAVRHGARRRLGAGQPNWRVVWRARPIADAKVSPIDVLRRGLDNFWSMDLEMEFSPGVPLRRQLEGALRVAIRSGRLVPGSVLPPSRDLADELGVSRGVVVDSYAQLVTEGYLTAKRGSGTHVALLPASGTPPAPRQVSPAEQFRYDLRPGQADFHAFPRAQGRRRWCARCVSCRTGGWATPTTAA